MRQESGLAVRVFTNQGLLSIVQDNADSERLLLRARQPGLLESLVPRPEAVFHDPGADCPYRVFLSRDEAYHTVCLRVWSAAKPLDGRRAGSA